MGPLHVCLMSIAVLLMTCDALVQVDMIEDCTANASLLLPSGFEYCNLSSIGVVVEEDISFDNIDTQQYLCGTEFRNVTWQVNSTPRANCAPFITQNISRIMARLPLPPDFMRPLPNSVIQRTTLQSLDPLPGEKPTALPKCDNNLVYVGMSDSPVDKTGCGQWTFTRTWSLHIVSLMKAGTCITPSGGRWDSTVFLQTVLLVDNSPPETFPIDATPGAYPKPKLAQPKPSVSRCDQPLNPTPPQFFSHPDCAQGTRVNLVQQSNIAPSAIFNHVCGSQFLENVWQAAYTGTCSGSSATRTQLVTLLPAPPVFTHVPGDVSITTSDSLSSDHLGHAVGASPCGEEVDVTCVDEPAVQVACGKWTINRVWTVALHFQEVDCILPERYTATASQLITISDTSAPQWVRSPPPLVHIPFFENYQADNLIPLAMEDGNADMVALNLISHPIKLRSQDGLLQISTITSASKCAGGLATLKRNWTVSDRCGNSRSLVQTLVFDPPPITLTNVQQLDPNLQWYYIAPGVAQLSDVCAPGKRVHGQTKEFFLTNVMGDASGRCDGKDLWSSVGCQEAGEAAQEYYIQDLHSVPPYFPPNDFPADITIQTTDSLDPSLNPALGQPQGGDYCSVPFTTSYHDDPPVKVGCGMWTIARTWKVQPQYADCGGAYPDTLTTKQVQVITITDHTAPQWVVPPEPEVQVPFFENYQSANSIPLAKEIAHDDMLALGLVSNPVAVSSHDSALVITPVSETSCSLGLASFTRTWTAVDACGNSQSFVQRIVLQHPPSNPTPTQPWRPADAGLAPADRDITAPNRLFAFVPGVEQLADGCYPGKRVVGSGAVFTGLWEADHNCSAGRWTETACRLEEQTGSSSVAVHAWPPFFADFPDNATIFTNQSLELEGPVGGTYCGVPFTISHHDSVPVRVQQSCGVWTIERTWIIQPFYLDCGGADAKYADALTSVRVQLITIVDAFPPRFIWTPSPDISVEFLEDYGTNVTKIPLVEDIATNPDIAALHLVSYPITLKYKDIHVDFFTGAASHVNGMAVVSRLWTTQDVCGNTATWLQTIRVRNPNAGGHPGPLGTIGNFTVFATNKVQVLKTDFSGSIGSNAQILLTATQPSAVVPNFVLDQDFTISHFSEKLLSFSNRLFIGKLNACTGPKEVYCPGPEQHRCQITAVSAPTVTTVSYDSANSMILRGDGLLYNIFNDVNIDSWRCDPPKVTPLTTPKQIIQAEGFIIINIVYSSLDVSKTMLRDTVFQQQFPAGDSFVLYNLKNLPEQPLQNLIFSNTRLTGSLLSQDAWNAIVFDTTLVTGQVFADNKMVTVTSSIFQGHLFVPDFQIVPPIPEPPIQLPASSGLHRRLDPKDEALPQGIGLIPE